jgi:hypothetical protein
MVTDVTRVVTANDSPSLTGQTSEDVCISEVAGWLSGCPAGCPSRDLC